MMKSLKTKSKGGPGPRLLEFQQAQLKRLESAEPISEETERLLDLVLGFLFEAQELKTQPLPAKGVAQKKLELLQEKMALLNKVSATGKSLLMEEGVC